jgi:anti-sigma factor RsiW
MSGPADWTETAARHQRVQPLLGAYADDEVNLEVRRAVEAHLSECAECAQEFRLQLAVGSRLRTEQVVEEPSASLERLRSHVAGLGRTTAGSRKGAPAKVRGILGHPVGWSGWLVAASLALVLLTSRRQVGGPAMGMSMGPLVPVSVDSVPEPVADAALHDFLRVTQAALPQGPELKAVQAEVPFSVPALRAPHMRLIGAWTTTIDHVPAAVLAYRCHDRLVVQYVIPEHAFFRQPRVRHAIAQSGLYAAGEGKIHAVGWPGSDNGSFLVGEFTASELAAMRM